MGLELNPSERRYLPKIILAGAGLTLVKLVFDAAQKLAAGQALDGVDYGTALFMCALIYFGVKNSSDATPNGR